MNEEEHGPKCWVEFTKSSSKEAGQGYKIAVAEGCAERDADLAYGIAFRLKVQADEATDPAKKMVRQLEESVA